MELKNEFEVSTGVEEAWTVLTDVERIAPCLPGAELREIEGDEYRGVVKVKVGPISAEYRGAARFVELDAKAHRAVLRAEGREARGQGNAAATITATLEPAGKGTKVSVHTDLSITGKVAQFGRGVLGDVSAKLLGQFVDNLESTVLAEAKTETASAPEAPPADPAPAEAAEETPAKAGRGSRRTSRRAAAAEEPAANEVEGDGKAAPAVSPDLASKNGAAPAQEPEEPAPAEEEKGAEVRQLEPRPAEPVDLFDVAGPSVAKRVVPVVVAVALLVLLRSLLRRRGE